MVRHVTIEVTVVPIEHVRVVIDAPFASVVERLRAETGLFDLADVQRRLAAGESSLSAIDAIAAMAGPSGFMRFLEADHDSILRLHGQTVQAVRFLIGHPLIAVRMTQRAIGSALYAPAQFVRGFRRTPHAPRVRLIIDALRTIS